MEQYDLDEIKTNLKATITSNKGGVDLKMVERDYENIVGERLPYFKLGFKSVYDFIQSLGGFKLERRGIDIIVSCLSSGKTEHLEQMIRKQKTSKKPKRKKCSTFNSYNSSRPNYRNFMPKQHNYSKRTYNKPAPMYPSTTSSNKTYNYGTYKTNNNSAYRKNIINKPSSIYSQMDKPRWPKNTDIQKPHSTSLINNLKTSSVIPSQTTNLTSSNTVHLEDKLVKVINDRIIKETLLTTNKVTTAVEKNKALPTESKVTTAVAEQPVKVNKVILAKKSNTVKVPKKALRKVLRNAPRSSTIITRPLRNPQPAQSRLQKYVKKEESITTDKENQQIIDKTKVTLEEHSGDSDLKLSTHINISKTPKKLTDLRKLLQAHYQVSKLQPESLVLHEFLREQIIKPSNTKSTDTIKYHEAKILQQTLQHKQNGVVVLVHSSSSIWAVLSYGEDFKKIQNDFNNFMSNSLNQKLIKDEPKVGNFYALYQNNEWHRVSVKSVDQDIVKVFQIDTGNYVTVCQRQLNHLNPQFYEAKSQAIEFALSKFKWIGDFQVFKDILIDNLVGKTFVITPDKTLSCPPTMILYDVQTMANMTEVLINILLEKCTPKLNPSLDEVEAQIMSVVDGFWYIRLKHIRLVSYFENLFSNVAFSTPIVKNEREIDYKNIYLATYNNNVRGRVKVIHFVDETKVKVFFVDYGVYKIVQIRDLVVLNSIDPLIARLPHQAIKIILQLFDPHSVTSETEQIFYEVLHKSKSKNFDVTVMNICYNEKYKTPTVQLYSEMYPSTFLNMVLYKKLKNL